MEEFIKALNLVSKDKIPILMFKREDGMSPLDLAIKKSNTKCTQMFIDILERFQDNIIFNYLVDPHFCSLVEMNIDLKEYLASSLPITQIKDERFPS